MSITIIVALLAWVFCAMPLHELGHWIIGKRIGLQNLKVSLTKWKGIPMGFQVTGDCHIDIKTKEDMLKWHYNLTTFHCFGSLFSILGVAFFQTIGVFSIDFAFLITLFLVLYLVYEVTNVRFVK
ncbi:MAG: hypothetical protein Q6356_000145 [Candidatus Wukongarchaeota archaeon]|nr:hypothetical protein [Candidatus Wukongarchaeota archaeon]